MNIPTVLALVLGLFLAGAARAEEPTARSATGRITDISSDAPRQITARVGTAGGTTSQVFVVTDQTKFSTAGFGVFSDLKREDQVTIAYAERDGGAFDALSIAVIPTTVATSESVKKERPHHKPARQKPQQKKGKHAHR